MRGRWDLKGCGKHGGFWTVAAVKWCAPFGHTAHGHSTVSQLKSTQNNDTLGLSNYEIPYSWVYKKIFNLIFNLLLQTIKTPLFIVRFC